MTEEYVQPELFENAAPKAGWDGDATRRALDELFSLTHQYRTSAAYYDLLKFVTRFRFYSPYNAMLIQIQMSGATYVATPSRWLKDYKRRIRPGARPLVILQPMGPVMFVFDVSDTEPEKDAPALPAEVTDPFEPLSGTVYGDLGMTLENAVRDGIRVVEFDGAAQSAGAIRQAAPGKSLAYLVKQQPKPEYVDVPVRYELLLNSRQSREAMYATLVHELAHLYCGHLGTPNKKWWPDRRGMAKTEREFEAESICYLVCSRLGLNIPSGEYLWGYLAQNEGPPPISLDLVMKVAGLIEQMGRERLKPRKETV